MLKDHSNPYIESTTVLSDIIIMDRDNLVLYGYYCYIYTCKYCHFNTYSFVPYTIYLWNNLDSSFVCAPSVSAFKNNLQLTSLM